MALDIRSDTSITIDPVFGQVVNGAYSLTVKAVYEEDGKEKALPDMDVLLLNEQDDLIYYGMTGENGILTFDSLPCGQYVVKFERVNVQAVFERISFCEDTTVKLYVNLPTTDNSPSVCENKQFRIYPNPLRNVAKAEFCLEKMSHVKLVLYDLAGKEISGVSLLYSQSMQSADKHIIEFPCPKIEPGLYLVRLFIDDQKSYTVKVAIMQ